MARPGVDRGHAARRRLHLHAAAHRFLAAADRPRRRLRRCAVALPCPALRLAARRCSRCSSAASSCSSPRPSRLCSPPAGIGVAPPRKRTRRKRKKSPKRTRKTTKRGTAPIPWLGFVVHALLSWKARLVRFIRRPRETAPRVKAPAPGKRVEPRFEGGAGAPHLVPEQFEDNEEEYEDRTRRKTRPRRAAVPPRRKRRRAAPAAASRCPRSTS